MIFKLIDRLSQQQGKNPRGSSEIYIYVYIFCYACLGFFSFLFKKYSMADVDREMIIGK